MKKILMLLLTITFLFSANKEVFATEIDLNAGKPYFSELKTIPKTDISYEFGNDEDYSFSYSCKIIPNQDNIAEVFIPEYSYLMIHVYGEEYLEIYEDKDMNNYIIGNKDEFINMLFLPKGTYYFKLKSTNKYSDNALIKANRISIREYLYERPTTHVSKKAYDMHYWFMSELYDGFSFSGDRCMYGVTYDCTFRPMWYEDLPEGTKKKYREIKFRMYKKNKDSAFKITLLGETKKILNTEAGIEEDTTKPTISGVKNNKIYKKEVTFKVSDESGIKKVTLNGKKIKVSKAEKGYKIKRKSSTKSYTLKVWDKKGNMKKVKFKIKKR